MPHLLHRDLLEKQRQRLEALIVQVEVEIHVLVDRPQLAADPFVQQMNALCVVHIQASNSFYSARAVPRPRYIGKRNIFSRPAAARARPASIPRPATAGDCFFEGRPYGSRPLRAPAAPACSLLPNAMRDPLTRSRQALYSNPMALIEEIQAALRAEGLGGWLFFDHHRRDPLAYRVLRFEPAQSVTRRWYYLVPASGAPRKLVHRIEPNVLDPLPGQTTLYSGWRDTEERLPRLLEGCRRVAMQYSPRCGVPYVSMVDAGTVELVRAAGVEVVTSANLIQLFEAVWTPQQYDSHKRAGILVDEIRRAAFARVAEALRAGVRITEFDVQQFIRESFANAGLITDHGPIVAVNANASNPHYEPARDRHSEIKPGDLLLIDLWAKLDQPASVFYDITWTAWCGATPPEEMLNVFAAVAGARDAAVQCVQETATKGHSLAGFPVDDACRHS